MTWPGSRPSRGHRNPAGAGSPPGYSLRGFLPRKPRGLSRVYGAGGVSGAGWNKEVARKGEFPGFPFQGEKDWQKYEVARRLKGVVHTIRARYRRDWKSKDIKKQQRAVALYFIDKVSPASPQVSHVPVEAGSSFGSWEFASLIHPTLQFLVFAGSATQGGSTRRLWG